MYPVHPAAPSSTPTPTTSTGRATAKPPHAGTAHSPEAPATHPARPTTSTGNDCGAFADQAQCAEGGTHAAPPN